MFIDPIKGYYLEKTIKYTTFFQIVTTLYILVKTLIIGNSPIIYYYTRMSKNLFLVLVILQCAINLYLLSSQAKNPKRWKAYFLLLSTILVSSIKIKKHSYSMAIEVIGVLLVLSCICVIIATHNYLKNVKRNS